MLKENNNKKVDESMQPTKLMKESANLIFRIPIFLSHPNGLNALQQLFVDTMIRQIRKVLLFPRTLPLTEQYPETPLTNIRRMISSSYGMVALNLKQQEVTILENHLNQPQQPPITSWQGSPFAQIEPAMAYQFGLPLLLIIEKEVEQNGVWSFGIGPFSILEWDSTQSVENFFKRTDWVEIFQNWLRHVRNGFYIQTQQEFKYTCNKED